MRPQRFAFCVVRFAIVVVAAVMVALAVVLVVVSYCFVQNLLTVTPCPLLLVGRRSASAS